MGENNIQLYNLQYTVAVCYNILDSFQKSFSYKTQNGSSMEKGARGHFLTGIPGILKNPRNS